MACLCFGGGTSQTGEWRPAAVRRRSTEYRRSRDSGALKVDLSSRTISLVRVKTRHETQPGPFRGDLCVASSFSHFLVFGESKVRHEAGKTREGKPGHQCG